jgi:hypothetical protein
MVEVEESGARYRREWRLAGGFGGKKKIVIIARVVKCWYLLEHVSMVGSVSKSESSSQVQLPC